MAAASAEPPPGYAALCQAAERNLGLRAKDSRQIEVDLNRSSVAVLPVPEAGKEAHRAALRRLLRAWCVLRPEVGYSQAMNFVASAMLCVVEHDENAAFRLFAALLGRLPPDFYAEQPPLRGFTVEVDALLVPLHAACAQVGRGSGQRVFDGSVTLKLLGRAVDGKKRPRGGRHLDGLRLARSGVGPKRTSPGAL